jgi:diguanylate cyclase (GGDEF)-like protein/PAS domain S-box-containing protein
MARVPVPHFDHILQAAVESFLQGVAVADLDGTLVYVNPSFLSLWHLQDASQALGQPAAAFWAVPDEARDVIRELHRLGRWQGELLARRGDGSLFPAAVAAHLIRDPEGQPRWLMAAFADASAQRATEAELQRARDNLYAAQRLARVGSWELDLVGNKLSWSAEIFRIFEVDPAAFGASYEAFIAAVHPDDRELVNRAYSESLAARSTYDYTHRLLMPDGRVKYVNERGEHYYDAAGSAVRSLGTVQDITEAFLARQALQDREEQVRLLLESTAEAIYGTDTRGLCTFVNPACVRVLGFAEAGELVGKPIHALIHHHHADGRPYPPEACRAYQAYVRNVPTHVEGEVFWRKDGTAFPVEYWAHPVQRRGEVVGAVVTFFDVTERHEAEQRLRQSAAVFDNAVEGIVITDPAVNILAVNQAFTHITGYDEAEVIGRNPRLLQSGRHDRAFYATLWQQLGSSDHWQGEIWNRRKNGEVFAELLSISAVRDQNGDIVNYVAVFSDITRLKQFEAELEHRAHYDALTDLPNRLLLNSRLEHALDHARRQGHRLAVLFMDLDRFKNINDTLGHPMGDALLQGFAQRLTGRIRGDDTVARLGGDEFVVVLENIGQPGHAALVAQDILELMHPPFQLGSQEVFVGTSIGISIYPNDGQSAEELIKHADAALYQAKEQGRGTYRFYTERLTRSANERLALETRLRHALQKQEFTLNYQPIYDGEGRIAAVEALARWQHPEDGLIPPDRFIPLAEETGLIVPLGEWVLEEACRQTVAWHEAGFPDLSVAVNLSARQFQHAELLERIRAILARTGIPPARLELEITESGMMGQETRSAELMDALKAMGLSLAIDDFGTGYSSLAYLKRLPVDKLKIDRSFVQDIPSDSSDMEIAATVIAMAKNLGLKVLAEGVESQVQLDFLRDKACDFYQGYHFSKPLSAAAMTRLLQAGPGLNTP